MPRYPQIEYWRFFLPLGLMAILWVAGKFVENFVLLQYEAGPTELAKFAVAWSIFFPVWAIGVFLQQTSNLAGRDEAGRRAVMRFALALALAQCGTILLLAETPFGRVVVTRLFAVPPDQVVDVRHYLRGFAFIPLLSSPLAIFNGYLVQARKSALVTAVGLTRLVTAITFMAFGVAVGGPPVPVLVGGLFGAEVCAMIAVALLRRHLRLLPEVREKGRPESISIEFWGFVRYYCPLALTAIMFAATRPLLYNLVALNGAGPGEIELMIGALALAFTFNFAFQGVTSQFRQVVVTFDDDMRGVLRFIITATLGLFALMVLATITPFAHWFLRVVQGAEGELLELAWSALPVLCVLVFAVAYRNLMHGLMMVSGRTGPMGVAGILRNATIYIAGLGLVSCELFTVPTCSALLVLGFLTEGSFIHYSLLRRGWDWKRGMPTGVVMGPDEERSLAGA